MRTLASLFAAALAFAALATSAAAKEIKSAKVCGPSDCVTVTDREKAILLIGGDGGEPGSPPPAASFYTVEVTIDVEAERPVNWTLYYVPSAGMTRPAYEPDGEAGPSVPTWGTVPSATSALFREVTKGMEPFRKPDLTSVAIGSRTVVAGADSYLRLFELPPTRASGSLPTEYSQAIDLRSKQPTPWTDMPSDLSFSPSAGKLERGGQVVNVPEELLADLRAAQPLSAADNGRPGGRGSGDGSEFPWVTLGATLTAALAVGLAIALLLRRVRLPFARRRPSEA
jgi:hypothetical protein